MRKTWTLPAGAAIDVCRQRLEQVDAQLADEIVEAEKFGYEKEQIKDAAGKVVYDRPAIEELIRWRLWDRTGAGLMAELGSHQLDAASIFISRRAQGGRCQREEAASAERGGGGRSAAVPAPTATWRTTSTA